MCTSCRARKPGSSLSSTATINLPHLAVRCTVRCTVRYTVRCTDGGLHSMQEWRTHQRTDYGESYCLRGTQVRVDFQGHSISPTVRKKHHTDRNTHTHTHTHTHKPSVFQACSISQRVQRHCYGRFGVVQAGFPALSFNSLHHKIHRNSSSPSRTARRLVQEISF